MEPVLTDRPPGKPFPDEHDYHGHPGYAKVFLTLLLLLAVSLVIGYFLSPLLAVTLIFLSALVKALLVALNFMHLKFEPLLVVIAVLIMVFILLAFFWGVFPDIPIIPPDVVK
jgi:caa(3)-type oxidase subunit IV